MMPRRLEFPDVRTEAAGVAQRAAKAERRRLSTPLPPPSHADESRWSDPEDTVNTRAPKQVRGYRRGDVLASMRRNGRGSDVTPDHVEAANRFRADWDIATVGLSGMDPMLTGGLGGGFGPVAGPKARDVDQLRAQREVSRVQSAIGAGAWPLLHWVVVQNRDVSAWVRAHADKALPLAMQRDLRREREMGKLLAALTRLAEHYGVDSREQRLKEMRRDMAKR